MKTLIIFNGDRAYDLAVAALQPRLLSKWCLVFSHENYLAEPVQTSDLNTLQTSHDTCLLEVEEAMGEEHNMIAVCNPHDLQGYVALARNYEYQHYVVEVT